MTDRKIDRIDFEQIIDLLVFNGYIDMLGSFSQLENDLWDLYKEACDDKG